MGVCIDLEEIVPEPSGLMLFVGITTDDPAGTGLDPDAMYLPRTLTKACWVLPRWTRYVRPEQVVEYAGRLGAVDELQLTERLVERTYEDPEDPFG